MSALLQKLAWCVATVLVYAGGRQLHLRGRAHPLLNPAVTAALVLYAATRALQVSWVDYKLATRPLALMLGPATVTFAVPVYRRLADLRKALAPALCAIAAGSLAAAASAMIIARTLGAPALVVRSLAPKSVTTPIAMAVSARIGGSPELTAGFVIFTGVVGALVVPSLFTLLHIHDRRARGIAIGIAAHGLGTARALTLGEAEGAFSILGMGISGFFVPIVVPLLARFC